MRDIDEHFGGLDAFTRSFERFGFHELADGSITFCEWCPGAKALNIIGDFSEYREK